MKSKVKRPPLEYNFSDDRDMVQVNRIKLADTRGRILGVITFPVVHLWPGDTLEILARFNFADEGVSPQLDAYRKEGK